MDVPSTVGRGIERLACQRLLAHLRVKTSNGGRSFPLSELAEATGLAPRTVEQAMARLSEPDSLTVERRAPEYGELGWSVRGRLDQHGDWETDMWRLHE